LRNSLKVSAKRGWLGNNRLKLTGKRPNIC
jgi:hypothetical protein